MLAGLVIANFPVCHPSAAPALLQGSSLTWRERAELADFLEGAGALLVQRLDDLQAQRQSSGMAGEQAARCAACRHALQGGGARGWWVRAAGMHCKGVVGKGCGWP